MTNLGVLRDILNSKPNWITLPLTLVIISLTLLNKYDFPEAIAYTFIFAVLFVVFSFIISKLSTKEKLLDLEKLSMESHTGKLELEKKREENVTNLLNTYNPDISNFFEILEKNGIKLLDDVEKELAKSKKRVYFIVGSGERPPKDILGPGSKTFFTKFIENLKLNFGYKIFRLNIYGTNSFLLFAKNGEYENVDKIYKSYYEFVSGEIAKIEDGTKKNKLQEWFTSLKKGRNPLIFVTAPYVSSLGYLITFLYDKVKKSERQELMDELREVLKSKVEIYRIKFGYLLQTVGFGNDLRKSFDLIELNLVNKLANYYGTVQTETYFSQFLGKKDFLDNFMLKMKELNEDLYGKIKNDTKHDRLVSLVKSLQTHIFGMV